MNLYNKGICGCKGCYEAPKQKDNPTLIFKKKDVKKSIKELKNKLYLKFLKGISCWEDINFIIDDTVGKGLLEDRN